MKMFKESSYPSAELIKDKIRALLPGDGSPILNRIMLVRVRQAFEASITPEEYFSAVDFLDEQRIIGRVRGAGGQIYLLLSPKTKSKAIAEKALMEPTKLYLRKEFCGLLELPKSSSFLVIDTSRIGPLKGTWARPDFVLITITTYAIMPGKHVDVHSFELKNLAGGSVSSVHEALAQTRFTHYGHFIWHVPLGAKEERMLPEVLAQCDVHGIGFIRASDPHDLIGGWEVLRSPQRKSTHVGVVDAFLQERLSPSQRALINGSEQGVPT